LTSSGVVQGAVAYVHHIGDLIDKSQGSVIGSAPLIDKFPPIAAR
jgi:hypothetical protein